MTGDLVVFTPLLGSLSGSLAVPTLIGDAGEKASEHFLEFFAATIRNPNTRAAYVQAAAQFCRWCEENSLTLRTIRPLHFSAYIETAYKASAPGSDSSKRQQGEACLATL